MHTNFDKACQIAMVDNKAIKEQLLNDLEQRLNTAKLIQMNGDKIITSINNSMQLNDKQQAI